MEPGDVTPVLLDAMVANNNVVVPHLHLPLQSGSDAVLRKMNRQYTISQYMEMIEMVNERLTIDTLPPAITTDIICGFPTETDESFEQTLEVASEVGYLHMHIFPYSVRTGTAAARWKQLSPETLKARVNRLIALDTTLSLAYRTRLRGHTVHVMIEQPAELNGQMKGRCEHYAEISLPTQAAAGSIVEAKVTQVQGDKTIAIPTLQIL